MIHVQSFERTCSYPSIVLFHLGNTILAFPPVLLKNTAANLTALISGDIHRKGPQSHHSSSSWTLSRPTASRSIPALGAHGPDRWSPYYYSRSRQGTLITVRLNDLPRARSELMARRDIAGAVRSTLLFLAQHHQEHQRGDRGSPSSSLSSHQHDIHLQTAPHEQKFAPSQFTVFVPSITQHKSAATHRRVLPLPKIATPGFLQ